jgi:hypothetical protein
MPEFAAELRTLLQREAPDLANQVDGLRLVARCDCGDSFCGSVSVLTDRTAVAAPPDSEDYDPGSIDLDARRGMVIVDVERGRLKYIETLDRKDLRDRLREVLP